MRSVAILGSTGSIGTQSLQVIAAHPDRFTVVALSAGNNLDLLARQSAIFRPRLITAAAGDADQLSASVDAYAASEEHAAPGRYVGGEEYAGEGLRAAYRPEILIGPEAASTAAAIEADVVLNGITGAIGLRPTLAALTAGSTLALANKESLIIGAELVKRAARPGQIVPVDSEHSAIAQALRSGRSSEVARLIVTASGGPFRGWTRAQLAAVTPQQALTHPNFAMGPVITTNSATLVNKGLEVIEAHVLFDVALDDIEVVVHPQQLIHSMVQFRDGSTIAQLGPPRMLVPIALGLSWPDRLDGVDEPCDWSVTQAWDFAPLDDVAFPAVRLAREVGAAGGVMPAIYNAANEVAVAAFHRGQIGFLDIVDSVQRTIDAHTGPDDAATVDGVLAADQWAREYVRSHL